MSGATLTRAEIVDRLNKELSFSRAHASNMLEKMIDIIGTELNAGNSIRIVRFGLFRIRHKKERIGRNPKTGESAQISERKVVTFKPSSLLRQRISETQNKQHYHKRPNQNT